MGSYLESFLCLYLEADAGKNAGESNEWVKKSLKEGRETYGVGKQMKCLTTLI